MIIYLIIFLLGEQLVQIEIEVITHFPANLQNNQIDMCMICVLYVVNLTKKVQVRVHDVVQL